MSIEFDTSPYVSRIGTLVGHQGYVSGMKWSPKGDWLASCSLDGVLNLWSPKAKQNLPRVSLPDRPSPAPLTAVAWSPDGRYLATSGMTGSLDVWATASYLLIPRGDHPLRSTIRCLAWAPGPMSDERRLAFGGDERVVHFRNYADWQEPDQEIGIGHESAITSIAWSPDGNTLVTGTDGGTIGVWMPSGYDNQLRNVLSWRGIQAHEGRVTAIAWSATTNLIASGASDGRIHLWSPSTGTCLLIDQIEFDDPVLDIAFASQGRILVAQTRDYIRFLRTQPLRDVHSYSLPATLSPVASCIAVDGDSRLATIDVENRSTIVVSRVNFEAMLSRTSYCVSGVSVCGEPSSGRTNLIRALNGQPFVADSYEHSFDTHRMKVPTSEDVDGTQAHREIVFWDLPSSGDYPLVSSIHVGGAAALMLLPVLSGSTLTAPENLTAWRHTLWRWNTALGRHKEACVYVITRCDQLRQTPSSSDVELVRRALSVSQVVLTSARTVAGIDELRQQLESVITWPKAPVFSSIETFQYLTRFVGELREQARFLTSVADLSDGFLRSHPFAETYVRDETEFRNGVRVLQVLGEVQLFEGRDEILLDRSYYYSYASAMIAAAQKDQMGMGRLPLVEAETGRGAQLDSALRERNRLPDRKQEQRLLALTINELSTRRVCQTVSTDGVSHLVFPSSLKRTRPVEDSRPSPTVKFHVTGQIDEIFDSMIVRLLGLEEQYPKRELWKHEAVFNPASGGGCGIAVQSTDLGDEADCGIYFLEGTNDLEQRQFVSRIRKHFRPRARNMSGLEETWIPVKSRPASIATGSALDVLLAWDQHAADVNTVQNIHVIKSQLTAKGVRWHEEAGIRPGETHAEYLDRVGKSPVAIMLLSGPLSPRQQLECKRLASDRCRVIPVILPNAPPNMTVPEMLSSRGHIDFRGKFLETDALLNAVDHAVRLGPVRPELEHAHLFLSYSRSDSPLVGQLRQSLEEAGHSVWWDGVLQPGGTWSEEIRRAIRSSYAFVLCVSNAFARARRSGIYPELTEAIHIQRSLNPTHVFVIPVRLDDCEIPETPLDATRTLRDLQGFDYFDKSQPVTALASALDSARRQFTGEPV